MRWTKQRWTYFLCSVYEIFPCVYKGVTFEWHNLLRLYTSCNPSKVKGNW